MFDISDEAADGLEAAESREDEAPTVGYRPFGAAPSPAGPAAPGPGPGPIEPASPVFPPSGDAALRRGAAKGLLLCSAGLVVGGIIAGPYGAGAGVVGMGALRNIVRAKDDWANPDPERRTEAAKSVTMAIFGLGIAGMLGYQAWHHRYGDDD